jgi:hypothetical protein
VEADAAEMSLGGGHSALWCMDERRWVEDFFGFFFVKLEKKKDMCLPFDQLGSPLGPPPPLTTHDKFYPRGPIRVGLEFFNFAPL